MNKALKLFIIIFFLIFSFLTYQQYGTKLKINYRKNLISLQRDFKKKMSKNLIKIKKENSKEAIVVLLLSCFVYGAVHAAGPGHGKVFLSSYVISKNINISEIIATGSLISFFHVSSSIIIVTVLKISLERILPSMFTNVERVIQIISYSLIILMGIYLFYHELQHHREKHKKKEYKNSLVMALMIGSVPCPGTITLLIFSLSLKLFILGLLGAFVMALGMAVTISTIGILTKFGKISIGKTFEEEARHSNIISKIIPFIGPGLIVIFGIIFLLSIIYI